MSKSGVNVNCLTGKTFVKYENYFKEVNSIEEVIKDAEIKTEKYSYAIINDKSNPASGRQDSFIVLSPESKIFLFIKKGFIEKVQIINGMVFVSLPTGKEIFTNCIKFNGMALVFINGKKNIFANTRASLYHTKKNKVINLNEDQQIVITENFIGEPEAIEQKFLEFKKTIENLGVFEGRELFNKVAEKSKDMLNAYLIGLKIISEKTGADFEQLKKNAEKEFFKYEEWAKSETEKYNKEAEGILNKDWKVASFTIPINKILEYNNIECKIISIKYENKTETKKLLTITIDATNKTKNQIFIFWNEEVRLIDEKDKEFMVENYTLETSFPPEGKHKGCLFFDVDGKEKKFVLQFGKKSLAKKEIQIDFTQKREVKNAGL